MPVVIGIHGPSGSGKTTLIERLIPRLAAHGLKVGAMKHAHDGLTVDPQGKDSWRMWQAGAQAVLLAAPQEILLRQRSPQAALDGALAAMPSDLDCVLIEGFTNDVNASPFNMQLRIAVSPEGLWLNGTQVSRDALGAVEEAIVNLTKPSGGPCLHRGRRS